MFPLDRPYHVVKFEPILDNPALVHHMILYSVPEFVSQEYFPCGETPAGAFPLYAWAVGMDAFETPEDVGFRVGQSMSTGSSVCFENLPSFADAVTQYIVLEIHYNNPEKQSGVVDSSGVRLHMTSDLRPIDAGIFVLGVNTGAINIPARRSLYEVRQPVSCKL
jgi:dopamine beta-monooxygenase